MDFQAKVIQDLGEKSGTSRVGNPWKKKEWVVETFGQYPKKIKVQCFGDRADSMFLEAGKDYNLFVDIESREYNGNWYTDVSVYRAEEITGQPQTGGQIPGGVYPTQQPQQGGVAGGPYNAPAPDFGGGLQSNESEEDLPF